MLRHLSIKNIAIISSVNIDFEEGFGVLTGETGAGKSIIIDSLNLLKGERVNKDLIRHGEKSARVDGIFTLNDNIKKTLAEDFGIDADDDEMLISREITTDGKNTVRVNGMPITASMLKEIGSLFITIHGQHDNTSLLAKKTHLAFLDAFIGEDAVRLKEEYLTVHREIEAVEDKIASLSQGEEERLARLEKLRFESDEIENAKLYIGEDDELEARKKILDNAQKIAECSNEALSLLYDGDEHSQSAHDALWDSLTHLNKIADLDKNMSEMCKTLTDIGYTLKDISAEIRAFGDSANYDENELNDIESRLEEITMLKRKYGFTIEDILSHLEKLKTELDEIENSDFNLSKLNGELSLLSENRRKIANKLTALRKKHSKSLCEKIAKELSDLDMKKVAFSVEIKPSDYRLDGADDVEFLICTNVGDTPKPLTKIASGGELSRIMLAIKSVLSGGENAETLVFDEIDTGVSGHAAQSLGEKLYAMSKSAQVICITHLPQIAAMASNHYLIEKEVEKEITKTKVTHLDKDDRINEIARLTGGAAITDITRKNAEEILALADKIKQNF